ncbi:MAG: translocation/assembly module TamB domain-containing protein [Rikenellaceae bacterium]
MKKGIKGFFEILAAITLTVVTVPIIVALLLQMDFVQKKLTNFLSELASEKVGVEVSVGSVKYRVPRTITISDFFVENPHQALDTMLFVDKAEVSISKISIEDLKFAASKAIVSGGMIKIESDSVSVNIKKVVEKLKSKNPRTDIKFGLDIDKIKVDSFIVAYNSNLDRNFEVGVDYDKLHMREMSISVDKFSLLKDSISAKLNELSFVERSGVNISSVKAEQLTLSPSTIAANGASLQINKSTVSLRDISLNFKEWNLSDFVNKVRMTGHIISSNIDMSTVEKFTGKKRNWKTKFRLIGDFDGYVSDLNCNIVSLSFYESSIRSTSLNLKGLPNIQNTIFSLDLGDFITSSSDLAHVANDFTGKIIDLSTLNRVGKITIGGDFNGKMLDFKSNGKISTFAGDVDFTVSNIKKGDEFNIKGNVVGRNINGETLLGVKTLKNANITALVDCYLRGKSTKIDMNGSIDSAVYKDYKYRGIDVKGLFENLQFTGYVGANDPNISFNFNGLIDYNDKLPRYDFDLLVDRINLTALNFNKRDSLSIFSGKVLADGTGTKLDDINGDVVFNGLQYINHIDTVEVGKIEIVAENNGTTKSLTLFSDFAEINISTKQSYKNIVPYFTTTLSKFLPALQNPKERVLKAQNLGLNNDKETKDAYNNYYVATVNVKETNNVASIFLPGLNISEDSKLSLIFNPLLDEFTFNFTSSSIEKENYWAKEINVLTRSVGDSISIFSKASQLNIGSLFLPNMKIIGGVKDDFIDISAGFENTFDNSNALININSNLFKSSDGFTKAISQIKSSYINFSGQRWDLESNNITIDTTQVDINSFSMRSGNESILVDGVVSKSPNDTLSVDVSKLKLGGFSLFTKQLGYNLKGNLNGNAKLYYKDSGRNFLTNFTIEDIFINDYEIPNLSLKSDEFRGNLTKYRLSTPTSDIIDATFNHKEFKFLAKVKIDDIDIKPLEPLLKVIGSDCEGQGSIDITVDNLERPLNINGDVDIKNMAITVDFTNVRYSLSGKGEIKDNIYTLKDAIITDPNGVTAPVTGKLDGNDRYRRVKYNIGINPQNLLCLNTTLENNPLFYGKVWGDGAMDVDGHGNSVTMSIRAKATNNSKFYMPLSDKSTISEADYITFVQPKIDIDSTMNRNLINLKKREKNSIESEFVMDMDVAVGSDTEVQIVIDPTLGDIIKGRGNGEFRVKVIPDRDIFTLNGGYEITSGDYLFTLSNFKLINKYFIIRPGSTISWNGDPLAANLDVTAVYKTKTSLEPLLGTEYKGSVDVDCDLNLYGQLLKPDITLGISTPDVDPETQSLLNSYLNTEEAISKQIFWLLFSNSFYSDASQSGGNVTVGMVGTAGAVTGVEFLSNQINNWISNDKFDLGFNYRPSSETTSDEVELNFSAPLLNDRLLLEAEGNYDFKNNTAHLTENAKTLSGNFSITYLLDESGNLQTKAFSRQIDSFDENQGLQENGVGIYYKESFNNLKDLKDKYIKERKKRQERRKERREDKK